MRISLISYKRASGCLVDLCVGHQSQAFRLGGIAQACTWGQPQPRVPCRVMHGHTLADIILSGVKTRAEAIHTHRGRKPAFAIMTVGPSESCQKYIRVKAKTAACVDIDVRVVNVERVTSEDIIAAVSNLNNDPTIDSFIIQLPLPHSIDQQSVLDAVVPQKDADGLSAYAQSRLLEEPQFLGDDSPDYCIAETTPHAFVPGMPSPIPTPESRWGYPRTLYPCTPLGVMALLYAYKVKPQGKKVVVLGESVIVGLPLSHMLKSSGASVSSFNANSPQEVVNQALKEADIIACAIGKPKWLKGSMIKKGAVVLDIGVNMVSTKKINHDIAINHSDSDRDSHSSPDDDMVPLSFEERMALVDDAMVHKSIPPRAFDCVDGAAADKARGFMMVGDVDSYSVRQVADMLTPVPGGIGPLTVAMLMRNVVMSAEATMPKQNTTNNHIESHPLTFTHT